MDEQGINIVEEGPKVKAKEGPRELAQRLRFEIVSKNSTAKIRDEKPVEKPVEKVLASEEISQPKEEFPKAQEKPLKVDLAEKQRAIEILREELARTRKSLVEMEQKKRKGYEWTYQILGKLWSKDKKEQIRNEVEQGDADIRFWRDRYRQNLAEYINLFLTNARETGVPTQDLKTLEKQASVEENILVAEARLQTNLAETTEKSQDMENFAGLYGRPEVQKDKKQPVKKEKNEVSGEDPFLAAMMKVSLSEQANWRQIKDLTIEKAKETMGTKIGKALDDLKEKYAQIIGDAEPDDGATVQEWIRKIVAESLKN